MTCLRDLSQAPGPIFHVSKTLFSEPCNEAWLNSLRRPRASLIDCEKVVTANNYYGRRIGSLVDRFHGVSGEVYAVDSRYILFSYVFSSRRGCTPISFCSGRFSSRASRTTGKGLTHIFTPERDPRMKIKENTDCGGYIKNSSAPPNSY